MTGVTVLGSVLGGGWVVQRSSSGWSCPLSHLLDVADVEHFVDAGGAKPYTLSAPVCLAPAAGRVEVGGDG